MRRLIAAAAVALAIAGVGGCSSKDSASNSIEATTASTTAPTSSTTTSLAPTTTMPPAPTTTEQARTAFDITGVGVRPIPDGGGVASPSAIAARPFDGGEIPALAPDYSEREYLVSGVAATYSGPAIGPATVASTGTEYVTRIVVRLPSDPSKFSGRVFMEPFNTSGAADIDIVWTIIGPMLEEAGDGWIGVTVRSSSIAPLQAFDPVRYADLSIASNDLEWDIIRHVGGLVKQGGEQSPLSELAVEHLYLGGFSQSGVDVSTFASAFNGETRMSDGSAVFDGYLPAAHSGSMTPLQPGTSALPTFESTPMAPVDVPVVDVETQSDVEGFSADITPGFTYTNPAGATVRRDDSDTSLDRFRLYEIPGAPHAAKIPGCDGVGSSFPADYFIRGAVDALYRWAEDGVAPQSAGRLELATLDVVSVAAVDEVGNALGGVRSPFVDVPLVRYEVHSTPGAFCALSGNETPLTPEQLVARYTTVAGYLDAFTKSLDETIGAGFLRPSDRDALLEFATTKAQALFSAPG